MIILDAPVDADGGQIEYRCRAAHDVQCHPRVTHDVTSSAVIHDDTSSAVTHDVTPSTTHVSHMMSPSSHSPPFTWHHNNSHTTSIISSRPRHSVSGPQRRQLRSTAARAAVVLRTRTQFGRRAFSVCGPDIWNSLPVNIGLIDSHPSFQVLSCPKDAPFYFYNCFYLAYHVYNWTSVMRNRSALCMTGHYNFYYVCMYVCIRPS